MLKGNIGDVSIASIVQLCCQEKKTGCLSFFRDSFKIGEIYFKNGEIIAARTDNLRGTDAFCRLIKLKKGEFVFQNHISLPPQEINHPYEYLILEAARYEDEVKSCLRDLTKKIQQITGGIKKLEEASSFAQNIFLLLSHCGHLLEAGTLEWFWIKEEESIFLFFQVKGELFKLTLPSHAALEDIFTKISP